MPLVSYYSVVKIVGFLRSISYTATQYACTSGDVAHNYRVIQARGPRRGSILFMTYADFVVVIIIATVGATVCVTGVQYVCIEEERAWSKSLILYCSSSFDETLCHELKYG